MMGTSEEKYFSLHVSEIMHKQNFIYIFQKPKGVCFSEKGGIYVDSTIGSEESKELDEGSPNIPSLI